MLADIVGQESVGNFFAQAIASGRLSHAYCLVGPEQIGKRTIAEAVAAHLLGVPREKLHTQPDWFLVTQTSNEKTGKTNKYIDVEQIRELRAALSLGSFLGQYKIAVIDGAEKMNESAANALLKTLEEPAPKTCLFLLTTHTALLPQTIRSRCQLVYVPLVSGTIIERYLLTQGASAAAASQIARLAAGRPGRAITWWREPEHLRAYENEIEQFQQLIKRPLHEKIALIEAMMGDKEDATAVRDRWQETLNLWEVLIRDIFYLQTQRNDQAIHQLSVPASWSRATLLSVSARLATARELISMNVNTQLAVEHILLAMP